MHEKTIAITIMIAMMMIDIASAGHPPPEAVMDLNPDPSEGILAGIPITFSGNDSLDVFDYEHKCIWGINGAPVSTECSFVKALNEGDYNVSLYVETGPGGSYGNDEISRIFHIYKNPAPEIEGIMKYYNPFNNDYETESKELTVPQFGSISIVVWNKVEAEKDDETTYSVTISPCCGIEVKETEEDGDNTTFSLFASQGTHNILVTARDEAGQSSSVNYVVKVQGYKNLEIEYDPDDVSEGADIKFHLKHPCSDDVCDYTTSIKDMERGETDSVKGAKFTTSFDYGPYNVTTNVSYNGTIIATSTTEFLVAGTVDHPPLIFINVTPAFAGEPINISLRAYDDGRQVKAIDAKIYGDYEDETRYTRGQVTGDKGNITFTPRKAGEYHVTAKACDLKQCSEMTFYFMVLEKSTEKVDEVQDHNDNFSPAKEEIPDNVSEKENQDTNKKTPGFGVFSAMIMMAAVIYISQKKLAGDKL